mmetsp:Transcript_15118/g.34434  ORF Transcript_15118/g.34434 Transcript_15118/m.34434 type:complete len:704 (+) Transcript_15118:533-2644(+)
MSMKLKVRYSLRELEQMAEDGNPEPLERLVRAWQALLDKMTPQDLHEHFYTLSPLDIKNADKFDTATALTGNHGNVLFPTWHRVYLVKLEQTLQQVSGDSAVTLPYWDETSIPSQKHGLPKTITRATFTFQDGTTINNPLRTTLLPKPEGATTITIEDQEPMAMAIETVASGSGDEAMANTDHTNTEHTEYFEAPQTEEDMEEVDQDVKKLNQNIVSWFTETTDTKDQHRNLINRYKKSLEAPNFMLFSNTTSQDSYNGNKADEHVVSLESVHNDVHLAVAGWNGRQQYELVKPQPHEPTELATLLDPLFWMHLCFLDYCFWIWQKKNDLTNLSSKSRRVRRSILDKTDAGTTLPSMVEGDETKGDDEGPPQSMTNSSNNNNSNSNSNSNNIRSSNSRMTTIKPGLAKKVGTQDRAATLLTLHTPLVPFAVPHGFRPKNNTSEATGSNSKFYYRSKDVIDIEQQLGYTYSHGSLDTPDILGHSDTLSSDDSLGESIRSDSSVRIPTCSKKLVVSGLDYLIAKTKDDNNSGNSNNDNNNDDSNTGQDTNTNMNNKNSLLVEAYAEWKGPKGLTKECLGYESIVIRQSNGAVANSRSPSYKSSISIPLALGLDPLEYARSVTLQVSMAGPGGKFTNLKAHQMSEDATSTTSVASSDDASHALQQPSFTTYQIKVQQTPENRNIYKAVIDPSDVLRQSGSLAVTAS